MRLLGRPLGEPAAMAGIFYLVLEDRRRRAE
jgi:hypothetical protein